MKVIKGEFNKKKRFDWEKYRQRINGVFDWDKCHRCITVIGNVAFAAFWIAGSIFWIKMCMK